MLDYSSSMRGQRWNSLMGALIEFVKKRIELTNDCTKKDTMSIIGFNQAAEVLVYESQLDIDLVKSIVCKGGETQFAAPLDELIKILSNKTTLNNTSSTEQETIAIFMSDGDSI